MVGVVQGMIFIGFCLFSSSWVFAAKSKPMFSQSGLVWPIECIWILTTHFCVFPIALNGARPVQVHVQFAWVSPNLSFFDASGESSYFLSFFFKEHMLAAKCVLDFGFFLLSAIHLPSAELSFQCCSETPLPRSLGTAGRHHLSLPDQTSVAFDSAGTLFSFVLLSFLSWLSSSPATS